MPFLMRYPGEIPAGTVVDALVSNLDFAPTFLDYAGLDPAHRMQGRSFRRIVAGTGPEADWPTAVYYRYWMHLSDHGVPAHYGIRTQTHKLIYYYGEALGTTNSIDQPTPPEWELFDLASDPQELRNVYDDPAHGETVASLKDELYRLKAHYGDER